MALKPQQEREFMFNHSWRVIKDKFYRDDFMELIGMRWGRRIKKLPSIGHNRDFANMFAELTGS